MNAVRVAESGLVEIVLVGGMGDVVIRWTPNEARYIRDSLSALLDDPASYCQQCGVRVPGHSRICPTVPLPASALSAPKGEPR